MVNFNGILQDKSTVALESNRGFLFGDALFETIKVVDHKILFLEDHYFRLMASMRICRMEIPMNCTLEFMEEQVLLLIDALPKSIAFRVRFTFFRTAEGYYTPDSNEVQYLVTAIAQDNVLYAFEKAVYEVELYKDFFLPKQLLSTLKTNNKMLQITGSIFAKENGYDTCLILNDERNVVEALHSNLFMKMGNELITPPISDGCLNGIMRKQVIEILRKSEGIRVIERSISPFDLQKADELFLTNVLMGIQPITKYRKKEFETQFAQTVLDQLNAKIRLS